MTTGSELTIEQVDVHDDAELTAWHACLEAATREGLGAIASVWTLPELFVSTREPSRSYWQALFVGRVDGEVVAAGSVETPLLDNLTAAEVVAWVLPAQRRRRYGSAMLAHVEAVAASRGRTILASDSSWPYDLGAEGEGWPGREFARDRGYGLALGDVQRHLDLPLDEALLDALAAEAAERHEGYTVRTWVGRIPDDLVLGWATLSSSLMTEAPTGDKQIEPQKVDLDALREGEDRMVKQQRTRYNAVALSPEGEVVAYTDVVATPHEPGRAYQWGTLVRADHRGHRLGLAVKIANHRQIQREDPSLREVVTWNAEVNAHMIGVNEQLGFRTAARLGEFEKTLDLAAG